MMQKLSKLILVLSLVVVYSGISLAQETDPEDTGGIIPSTRGPQGLVLGGGGTNTGAGSGVEPDEFTGSATYSISVPVPPGRGGVEPQLVLNYNSHRKNANSWVGYGWEFDLGSIVRIPENGNIDYYNGESFEARFAGQSETLVLVSESVGLSSYGIDGGSNVRADLYQARIESAFNIYLHLRDFSDSDNILDKGWVVIDKSGKRYTFGKVDNSREQTLRCLPREGRLACNEKLLVARWLLNSVKDPNGNIMQVNYGADRFPSTVTYQDITIDFNKNDGISSPIPYYPTYRQAFLSRYQMGNTLRDIVIYDGGMSRLQKISFTYETSDQNGLQLLKTVTQYGKNDSTSLPPTEFEYYGYNASFETDDIYILATRENDNNVKTTGIISDYTQFADMNGDGLIDQVVGFSRSRHYKVYFNNGEGFEEISGKSDWASPIWWGTDSDFSGKLTGFREGHQWIFLMDMNGDSLPDHVARRVVDEQHAKFAIAFNSGSNWADEIVEWDDPYVGNFPGTSDEDKGFFDMNGDGLIDRIVGDSDDGGFRVYYNTGSGFETTSTLWKDPLAIPDSSNSAVGKIFKHEEEKIYVTIRDMNGDGLPDRVWKTSIHFTVDGGAEREEEGFGVALNRNGIEWAQPDVSSDTGSRLLDGIDNLGIIDPVEDNGEKGYFTKKSDWIDFNTDGYLDRVEGRPDEDNFYVHFYKGMTWADSVSSLSEPVIIEDPVSHQFPAGNGSVRKDLGSGREWHTLTLDLNGDGYPDRIETNPQNTGTENERWYYSIYLLKVNEIEFTADSLLYWNTNERNFNQPAGILKSVSDGKSGKMEIEYLPSTWPVHWPNSHHRFLPLNLYLAHKIYVSDYTLFAGDDPSYDKPEWHRHEGMRWTTYFYLGGNLFVRYGPDYYSHFNGFQEVQKLTKPMNGDFWDSISKITKYYQAAGAVDVLSDEDNARFDSDGYTHYALSGRPYEQKVISGSTTRVTEENLWEINRHSSDDNFSCSETYCFVRLMRKIKTVKEEEEENTRVSRINYEYDGYGNITWEKNFDGGDRLLLEKETIYYPSSHFDPTLHIRDHPEKQTKKVDSTVYRHKEFDYDNKGNPRLEKFFVETGSSDYVTINRDFYENGNLKEITDIDGVTKTITYDSEGLFPITETVSGEGQTLVARREFNRLNGEVSLEIGPQGIGKKTDYDDFGRPVEEYVRNTSGSFQTTRRYSYEYQNYTVNDWDNVTVLKTQIWEPQEGYSDTDTNPSQIAYADSGGNVLQQCTYTERGNHRLIHFRIFRAGRWELKTEPVFANNCNFTSELPATPRIIHTFKDLLGRTVKVDMPDGDSISPVGDVKYSYSTNSDGMLVKTTTFPIGSDREKKETFDDTERLVRFEDPDGTIMRYVYNPVGDLREVIGAGQTLTTIEYDLLGRKKEMTDANMGTWTYDYDDSGRLEFQTDSKGQKIHNHYDDLGRTERKDILNADENLEKYELYTYDEGDGSHSVLPGELFKVEEFDAAENLLRRTSYGYDTEYRRASRITRFIPGIGELEQTLSHDFRGNVTYTVYPSGEPIYYKYNRVGGLEKLCSNDSCNAESGEIYYSIDPMAGYDELGALQKEDYGNGVSANYQYYPQSHRMERKWIGKEGEGFDGFYSIRRFEYDRYSNIKLIDEVREGMPGAAELESVTYDNLNRLKTYRMRDSSTVTLDYDAQGNMKKNTASFGSDDYLYNDPTHPHAVTDIGDEHFTYDSNGNMTADGSRTMTYNAQNQLTRVTMTNGVIVDFDYDYTGTRASKKVRREDPLHRIHEATTHYLGDAMEIKGDRFTLNIHAGSQRIATKALGTIEEIMGPGGAGLTDAGIYPEMRFSMAAPYLMFLFTLFAIASLRPVRFRLPAWAIRGPPRKISNTQSPISNKEVFNKIKSTLLGFGNWDLGFPLLDIIKICLYKLFKGWSSYTLSLNEALKRFHYRPAFKFASLVLVFLFVVQFPMLAMADPTTPPADVLSDPNFFYYTHGDHLGSSHILTEGKGESRHSGVMYRRGQLLQRFEYAPFGQETYVLNPNLKFDPSYTGQTYDIETGLYYYKARYYNSKLARFIQPDTVVPDAKNLQAYNKYSYVINNPLKYIDPTGHFFFLIGLVAIGIALSNIAALIGVNFILAAMITGMVTGVITGAISGGWKGALLGGLFGAIQGAASGGMNVRLGATIMAGAGASLSYATGGWKGLRNFGITIFASYALNRLAGAAVALLEHHRSRLSQIPEDGGGPDLEDVPKLERIIEPHIDDGLPNSTGGNPPLSFHSWEEYNSYMQSIVPANQQTYVPMTAEQRLAGQKLARDFIVIVGISAGTATGPEILTICLSNPIACNRFGAGFVAGFAEGSGIGTTGQLASDLYEGLGSYIGKRVGSFFDF